MLTIYRASAGAGKTHVLTGEYLQLLFSGVDIHAKILSVTFTNKATDEMKQRIITELHRLSSGQPSNYLPSLIAKHRKPEEAIRHQARNILIHILHDYSRFNISTIDHFFQQTLRAFIRETGINSNYRVEMDTDLVLTECVDNLLADLDRKENRALLKWLLRFSEDKVEKGEDWNFRRDIKKLADELFKEKYVTTATLDTRFLQQLMDTVEKETKALEPLLAEPAVSNWFTSVEKTEGIQAITKMFNIIDN